MAEYPSPSKVDLCFNLRVFAKYPAVRQGGENDRAHSLQLRLQLKPSETGSPVNPYKPQTLNFP